MELKRLVSDFVERSRRDLRAQLESGYGLDPDETDEIVDRALFKVYGPALALADKLCSGRTVLFIEKEGCPVCRAAAPELERFLRDHPDFACLRIEYSTPEGLLYHILYAGESGKLPLVAVISDGILMKLLTGDIRELLDERSIKACENLCEVRAPKVYNSDGRGRGS